MSGRFVFFGTGANFSLAVFEQLVDLNQLPLAVAIPEYPPSSRYSSVADRLFENSTYNPLIKKVRAANLNIIYAPDAFQSRIIDQIEAISIDFILVACWPYLLSENCYSLANKAALNLHPSLLPDFRGVDPVGHQLHSNNRKFGVSLHLLSEQFDSGDIVNQAPIKTFGLVDRVSIEQSAAVVGTDLFIRAMDDFGTSAWQLTKQL